MINLSAVQRFVPLHAASALVGTTVSTALAAATAVADTVGSLPLNRQCSRGDGRAWIAVNGLDGPAGDQLGHAVLETVQALPGITSASLNRPLSRIVVAFDADGISLRELCHAVDNAEKQAHRIRQRAGGQRPASLPGDGLLLATRAAMLGASSAGLGIAAVGRALHWPALPSPVLAVPVAINSQPWLRRLIEDRISKPTTDTVLGLAITAAETVTLSVASLAVDAMTEALKAAESHAEAHAWARHEPELARHAEQAAAHPAARPRPAPKGPIERHRDRSAWAQAIGAAAVGAATANVNMAATAALVAAPKATHTTRESFAATLGRGLADRYGILPLRPDSLRRLDRIDALVLDPRVLRRDGDADFDVDADVEALICRAHDPLASAVLAEARRAGLDLVSVEDDSLGELRTAFDELEPLDDGSIEDALARAVAGLQKAGHTVAALSSTGAQALSSADLALGMLPTADTDAPPWYADLMLPDLAGAWRVLHAIPAARSASQRSVELATAASALGALLMLPGVRGRGPGPVTTGAGAGLLSGYLMARGALNAPEPRPAPVYEWHAMTVEQVREQLPPTDSVQPAATQHRNALTGGLEKARRGAHLAQRPGDAVLRLLKAIRAELDDPLTPMLAIGAAASAVLGSPVDALMVGSVLSGNAILAASQRLRAEGQLNRLLAQQIPPARKVAFGPDGSAEYTDINAEQLRPGDVIEVRTDEVVPADARLIHEEDLEVDEATLTGESLPVEKHVEPTPGADLAERRCMLFAGTNVVAGTGIAVVTAVGADTQARRAAELASGELPHIGLQHQLSQLTNRAWPVSVTGGLGVSALGLLRGRGIREAVSSGIAVTVAAVPEGMPLVATLAQQASARRLTNFGALVRIPRAIEALGRVDVVCFDKTGTLSENRLRVAHVHPIAGHSRAEVLRYAAHATPPASNGGHHIHATDGAIITAARAEAGTSESMAAHEPDLHLPFRSGRSFSASVSGAELTVKGAPEVVAARAAPAATDVTATVAQLAAKGLRVIAVAHRQLSPAEVQAVAENPDDAIETLCTGGLTLIGFLGLSDTPRAEAAGLLAALPERQVDIRLITGDHPITAAAIAEELGMPVTAEQVITGSEWEALSRKGQERAVGERVVFARMSPENKVQIVQTLERTGRICAMVGDGANDAAAIRAATVGIGVVSHGSDPARTAADVVLVDGRIEALLQAIDEGRQLWQRVQAAVSVLLGGNAGEVAFAIIGSAITGRSPLNTRQLLLVNMLTDALPAAALAVSTPSGRLQLSEGRGPDERALWRAVGVRGATTALAATTAWAMASVTGLPQRASTVALVALVAAQLGQTLLYSHDPLVVLTAGGSLAVMGTLISIPGVSQLVGCTPLGPIGWAQGLGAAAVTTVSLSAATHFVAGRRAAQPVAPPPADSPTPDQVGEPRPPRAATTRRKPASPAQSTHAPTLRLVGQPPLPSST